MTNEFKKIRYPYMVDVYNDSFGLTYGFLRQGFENRPHVVFDRNNVAMMDYGKYDYCNLGSCHYNIAAIGEMALEQILLFEMTKGKHYLELFLSQVKWFVDNVVEDDRNCFWTFNYDYLDVKAPWVSGIANGLALSCLTKAYLYTGEKHYIDMAVKTCNFYNFSVENGGFKSRLNGYVCYEEYTNCNPNRTAALNGFLIAILGLLDFNRVHKCKISESLITDGIVSLKNNIKEWELFGGWSNIYPYRNMGMSSSIDYHIFHYELVYCIAVMTSDPEIYNIYKRWAIINPKISRLISGKIFNIKTSVKKSLGRL